MKRTHVALWLAIVVMFLGCEGNLTQPDQVNNQETEFSQGFLAKEPRIVAKLDSILPDSTIYVLPDDTSKIYFATGGELLPGGAWTNNLKGQFYEVHLYSEMKVGFGGPTTVTIDFPTNVEYLNSHDNWIGMLTSGTVSAKAVRTGIFGGAALSVSTQGDYDDDDTQGGN